MNSVQLTGRIARPEVKEYSKGKMLKFSLADKAWAGGEEKTNWFNCVLFGKRVDSLEKYLVKGAHVSLTGKLDNNVVEKDGRKTTYTSVVVDQVALGPKNTAAKEDPFEAVGKKLKVDPNFTGDEIPF